ncbi:MAG TPA: sulfurtransferase TusA family protein [Gammaproteobacteria bacterium]|nr:sulfurtransferase TusA family protein [Gammaproteobacteria bacterium]
MARYDLEMDLSGLEAPMHLLRARKAMEAMSAGQTLHVVTTVLDCVPEFETLSRHTGGSLLGKQMVRDRLHFVLRKN